MLYLYKYNTALIHQTAEWYRQGRSEHTNILNRAKNRYGDKRRIHSNKSNASAGGENIL